MPRNRSRSRSRSCQSSKRNFMEDIPEYRIEKKTVKGNGGSSTNKGRARMKRRGKRLPRSQWCSAKGCSNNRYGDPDLSFFRFPRDEERCRIWVKNCRRHDLMQKSAMALFNGNVLCSKHFEDSQYASIKKTILKQLVAIPTLFDVPNPPSTKRALRRYKVSKDRKRHLQIPAENFPEISGFETRLHCVGYNCGNTTDHRETHGLSFHGFPSDSTMRQLWLKAMKRQDFTPTSHSQICAEHFTEDCFIENQPEPQLKKDAIPTLFEFPKDVKEEPSPESSPASSPALPDNIEEIKEEDLSEIVALWRLPPHLLQSDQIDSDSCQQNFTTVIIKKEPGLSTVQKSELYPLLASRLTSDNTESECPKEHAMSNPASRLPISPTTSSVTDSANTSDQTPEQTSGISPDSAQSNLHEHSYSIKNSDSLKRQLNSVTVVLEEKNKRLKENQAQNINPEKTSESLTNVFAKLKEDDLVPANYSDVLQEMLDV